MDKPRPLSPSRANQFKDCQLLFRYRTIDALPEPPGTAAVRGNLVHLVLERIFDEPAYRRDLETASAFLPQALIDLIQENPHFPSAIDENLTWQPGAQWSINDMSAESKERFIAESVALLKKYFTMEDPQNLQPSHREHALSTSTDAGIAIHGIIDRIETNPAGEIRISDYKTGKSPHPKFRDKAWFQLLFYALLVKKEMGKLPSQLQLLYLGDSQKLVYTPSDKDVTDIDLAITEIANDIANATENRIFEPRVSKLCDYCFHQKHCPAKDGELLPWPTER
jgi:putative RecB family exonuclease